ncbi:hypothetical protein JZ751_018387 [Albula glossodonta]|uniref:Uncharacterized protein n=1 Tax=Albula glossodonta TaxID=121402 RepID=A0A8T2N587_9TELE|nr:hypothetical protein JZ751_018387 [Albula glossodonta]
MISVNFQKRMPKHFFPLPCIKKGAKGFHNAQGKHSSNSVKLRVWIRESCLQFEPTRQFSPSPLSLPHVSQALILWGKKDSNPEVMVHKTMTQKWISTKKRKAGLYISAKEGRFITFILYFTCTLDSVFLMLDSDKGKIGDVVIFFFKISSGIKYLIQQDVGR